jgi:hypothetical protein
LRRSTVLRVLLVVVLAMRGRRRRRRRRRRSRVLPSLPRATTIEAAKSGMNWHIIVTSVTKTKVVMMMSNMHTRTNMRLKKKNNIYR